jgi:hypothetical protein
MTKEEEEEEVKRGEGRTEGSKHEPKDERTGEGAQNETCNKVSF